MSGIKDKLFTINKPKSEISERDVKRRVKQIITACDPDAYIFMPVQSGYGSSALDFIVQLNGLALHIETKIKGKTPTARQKNIIDALTKSCTASLIVDQENLQDVFEAMELMSDVNRIGLIKFCEICRNAYWEKYAKL